MTTVTIKQEDMIRWFRTNAIQFSVMGDKIQVLLETNGMEYHIPAINPVSINPDPFNEHILSHTCKPKYAKTS